MTIKTPNYRVIKFDLSEARTQEELHIKGGFIGVQAVNGDFFVQLDNKSADPINLKLLPVIRTKFEKIYMSNASQSGGYILFVIGRPCEFDASLGTINPQHANIPLPHQNIPRIKPTPITRPTVIYPSPPEPIKITQITASNTIQYNDKTNHHVTTVPLDIFTSTPLQTKLRGSRKISFHLSNLVGRDMAFDIVLLSADNVRTPLIIDISDHWNRTQPITIVRDIISRTYSINDKIIIHGKPCVVDGSGGPDLVVSNFKIMFDVV